MFNQVNGESRVRRPAGLAQASCCRQSGGSARTRRAQGWRRGVAVLLVAGACISSCATEPNAGSFTAIVSGDLTASHSGTAVFDPSGVPWRLTLVAGDLRQFAFDVITVSRGTPGTPVAGSYPITGPRTMTPDGGDFDGLLYSCRPGREPATFGSVSGWLFVTAVGRNEFRGTLDFTAVRVVGADSTREITVRAEFTAELGATPPIPDRCW
jgi:hypothetical protein